MYKETVRDRHFYDINAHPVGVVAGAFLEEGTEKEIERRINKADVYPRRRLDTDGWDWNEHSGAEKIATTNAFELAEDGYNLIIWVSPDDGGRVYKEGRLNVYLPVKVDGEWALQGWGIPLLIDRHKSLDLGERLLESGGVSMDPINSPESLRRQPIGFRVNNQEDWLEECKTQMPEFGKLWEYIEQGKEVENKKKVEADVRKAMAVARGDNRVFEMVMARMGHGINQEGGHGSSWLGNHGIYNFSITKIGGNFYTEAIKVNGRTVCPVCGVEVGEMSSHCGKCGVRFRDKN